MSLLYYKSECAQFAKTIEVEPSKGLKVKHTISMYKVHRTYCFKSNSATKCMYIHSWGRDTGLLRSKKYVHLEKCSCMSTILLNHSAYVPTHGDPLFSRHQWPV